MVKQLHRSNLLFLITCLLSVISFSINELSIYTFATAIGACMLVIPFAIWFNLLKKETRVKSTIEKIYIGTCFFTIFLSFMTMTANLEKKKLAKNQKSKSQNYSHGEHIKKQNNHLKPTVKEIVIAVTQEPTNGLTEKHLKNIDMISIIEERVVEKIKERSEQAFRTEGETGKLEAPFFSESWGITIKNKSFVVVKISVKDILQMKSIMGIKDGAFIKISGTRKGPDPVPHSYGPLAEKFKDVFGLDLNLLEKE